MEEPILDTHEIQGDIVPGFNKSHQVLLGVRITDAAAAKRWLRAFADEVASAEEVFQALQQRHRLMTRRGREPTELATTWVNVAFSAPGLLALGRTDVDQFEDTSFQAGLAAQSPLLGDPLDADDLEGSPKNWEVGGTDAKLPHVLLIVASDIPSLLAAKMRSLKKQIGRPGSGLQKVYEERGKDLPGKLGGHEHFGFKDGVSQPGVRGRLHAPPHEFLTLRLIDSGDPMSVGFAKPGQPLVWPGQFILGYESQDPQDALNPLPPRPVTPAWLRNGSYLVFRRLRQDVAQFRKFVQDTAAELSKQPGFDGLKAAQLAAILVGRWPSGAPVMRSPSADDLELARDRFANNHFGFDAPAPDVTLVPGVRPAGNRVAGAPGDPDGLLCPTLAHIRKVNPRDRTTDEGSSTDTLARRILRRGIPFGAPLRNEPDPLRGKRGLLFLCYQASIRDQFEFLCVDWMNQHDSKPEPNTNGHDLLVGQHGATAAEPDRVRRGLLSRRLNGQELHQEIFARQEWVIPTGGGYFFAPSISAIREVLSG